MSEYEYKIKKRKATKIEELPPKKMARYRHSKCVREALQQPNRHCVRCGQEANVVALFKVDRKGTMIEEKYCNDCLQKWVAIPN